MENSVRFYAHELTCCCFALAYSIAIPVLCVATSYHTFQQVISNGNERRHLCLLNAMSQK